MNPDMERITLLCLLSSWFGASSAQEIRNVNVPEGDDALLPCGLGSQQRTDEFDWRKDNGEEEKMEVFEYIRGSHPGNGQNEQFKNRVEFFHHELKSGNASILIKNTRLEDNGTYTCGLGLLKEHRQEFNIRLNVDGVLKIRNVVGAARVPYIRTIDDEITWRSLECKVKGVPAPEVEWRNSAGKVLAKHVPEGEDVKLQVKVTESDNYTCVVTQRDIHHQINNTMKVSISDTVIVMEGDDALLPCALDSKESIQRQAFSWRKGSLEVFFYDRGRVEEHKQFHERLSHFESEFASGNASIKIHKTQKTDSGQYICNFPDVQKSHVTLYVVEHSTTWAVIVSVTITSGILLLVFGAIVAVYCIIRSRREMI